MTIYQLGIGEFGATRTAGDQLITYALGSCVALLLIDALTGAVGMAHIALPEPGRASRSPAPAPGYYASDAVPELIAQMTRLGVQSHHITAKLVGGASIVGGMARLDIGKRNVAAIRRLLRAQGLVPAAEDIGGGLIRTVRVCAGSFPTVTITDPARGSWTV